MVNEYKILKLHRNELIEMPWDNGGGTTTEISRGGKGSGSRSWDWRVSVAGVETDGAFSTFPGIDRLSCVIEGKGMDLEFSDGRTLALDFATVVKFDGDTHAEGKLRDGPLKNFNVMIDRQQMKADLQILTGSKKMEIVKSSEATHIIHAFESKGEIVVSGDHECIAEAGETLVIQPGIDATLHFEPHAKYAHVILEKMEPN